MQEDVHRLGLAELKAAYAAGDLDPVAATEAYLARIAAEDTRLHSFITVAAEAARAAAEESRRRWQAGRPLGPLDGIPVAVKDNIGVAGLPCTAGTTAFRDRIPAEDAPVVARLRQAGAILLGKLNMDEGALGATGDNPVYGRCMNPLMPDYTPGGSSSGAGAAVAGGLCAAALGTDTMGSVRVPAAYCGIYGLKPTKGAIAGEGVVPLSFSLDCVGPLALSAADLEIIASSLLEPLPRAFSTAVPSPSLSELRVGVPRQLDEVELTSEVRAAFGRFCDALRDAGATVVPADLASWHPGKARRAGLLVSEAEGAAYYKARLGAGLPGLSAAFASMLRYPEKAGVMRLVAAYETIETIRLDCLRAFADIDVLVLPTTPQTSFPHDSETPLNQADCTALANFVRGPAVSLPMPTEGALPAGMQLMAPPDDDRRLLRIAVAVDRALAARL